MSGGDGRVVKMAIQNFIASIPGMICDGGKYSCSIKGAIVSDSVYQSAMLALNSTELPYASGILGKNAEESIRNLGEIFKAVKPLNERILKIIASKQE
jgi:L-cysteine desulfidase